MSIKAETELFNVLLSPHVSEKSTRVASDRQYVFKVSKDSQKDTIKKAVELLFKVKVIAVCVSNVKGKKKTFGRTVGKRPGWKKAYVTLAEGDSIELGSAG